MPKIVMASFVSQDNFVPMHHGRWCTVLYPVHHENWSKLPSDLTDSRPSKCHPPACLALQQYHYRRAAVRLDAHKIHLDLRLITVVS